MTVKSDRLHRPVVHYGFIVLFTSVLTNLAATGLGRFSYSLILPFMKDGMGLSYTETGWLATANLTGYLLFSIAAGALAAKYGLRVVSGLALLLEGGGLALTGASAGFGAAVVGRIVSGVGSAGANVPAMASMSAWFAPKRRGLATGIVLGGSGFGTVAVGWFVPAVTGSMGPDQGWRYCWYGLAAVTILIGFVVLVFSRSRPSDLGLRPVGASVLGSGQAVQNTDHATWLSALARVYRARYLWHLAAVYAAWGLAYIVFATFFAAYLTRERGFSVEHVGMLWGLIGLLSGISGFLWGWVADAFGRKASLLWMLAIQGASFALFALSPEAWVLQLGTVLYGVTGGGIPAVMAAAAADHTGSRLAPAAVGFLVLVFGVGQAIGPAIGGYVADSTGSFVGAYWLSVAMACVGAAGALFLRQPQRRLE